MVPKPFLMLNRNLKKGKSFRTQTFSSLLLDYFSCLCECKAEN
jgi:hypothetical protein